MSTHEDFSSHAEVRGSSDRTFGLVFAVFFALIGLAPLRRHQSVRGWALVVAAVVLLVALILPNWLHWLNIAWTKLGLLLGRIVSPVLYQMVARDGDVLQV